MILGVPSRPGLRIMVACKPIDFRKGMNSLAALVTQVLARILSRATFSSSGPGGRTG
jgi:transposase